MSKKKQKPVEIVEESDEVEENGPDDNLIGSLAASILNLTELLYEKYEH